MRVYVVRHGESVNNVAGLWTGWENPSLTDKGRRDAEKAGSVLRPVSFDKVFASDLDRAIETAQIAIPGCACETTPLLREINVGRLANAPFSSISEEQKNEAVQNGYGAFDGETKAEFRHRMKQFIQQLEGLSCENVALFTHAGWVRSMLEEVLQVQIKRSTVWCGNCVVGVFEYVNGIWRLYSWINP